MLNRCTTDTKQMQKYAKSSKCAKYAKCATKNAKNAKIAKKQKNAQQMLNYHIYGVKSMQVLSTVINIWHPKLCLLAKSFYKNPY